MSYLPARSSTRRLAAAGAAVAAAGVIASAAYAASASPAAHAAAVIPACTGTASIGAWIAVGQATEAAGTTYYPLEFTNTGGYTCSLSGYPVVSAISGAGARLGRPAGRGLLTAAPLVVLAPGATAHTTLAYHDRLVSAGGGCGPVDTAVELRVYPAGQTHATYAAFGFGACSHAGPVYLTITQPVRAGVGTDQG